MVRRRRGGEGRRLGVRWRVTVVHLVKDTREYNESFNNHGLLNESMNKSELRTDQHSNKTTYAQMKTMTYK